MLGTATVETRGQTFSLSKSIGNRGSRKDSTPRASMGTAGQPYPGNATQGYSTSETETATQSQSESISQAARPLHTPDEVRRLGGGDQFMILRGMHPIQCWRPPYWTVFPSLPEFSLKEVLDTVGRDPRDDGERAYFERWKRDPFLMTPQLAPPAEVPALPAPEEIPAVAPPARWRIGRIAAAAVLLLGVVYWLWPSSRPPPLPPV